MNNTSGGDTHDTESEFEETTVPITPAVDDDDDDDDDFGSSDEDMIDDDRAASPHVLPVDPMDDLVRFVNTSAPQGSKAIQCRVTRDRRGIDRGMFPTYYMHMERSDGKRVFLLAGAFDVVWCLSLIHN